MLYIATLHLPLGVGKTCKACNSARSNSSYKECKKRLNRCMPTDFVHFQHFGVLLFPVSYLGSSSSYSSWSPPQSSPPPHLLVPIVDKKIELFGVKPPCQRIGSVQKNEPFPPYVLN